MFNKTPCHTTRRVYDHPMSPDYIEEESEEESEEELIAVELTARFIMYVMNYHGDHADCEMFKVKQAIEYFDFNLMNSESIKQWGHIFNKDQHTRDRYWIYITQDEHDVCEVPPNSWWTQVKDRTWKKGV